MARQQTEDELNIKRRARRRLIGAIALALAVVVGLPMVLDREPKTEAQDIDLRIPAPDKVGEFVPGVAVSEVIEAASMSAESAVSAVSAVSEVSTVSAVSAASLSSAGNAPVVAPHSSASGKINIADAQPPTKLQADNAPEIKQVEPGKLKVQPVEVEKSDAKKAEVKKADEKKADAKKADEKKVDAKKAEAVLAGKALDMYIVQVGAFSNAVTATAEADKLKAWGFKAYTELVGGTTRVRVGPYADKDKADQVRALLEKHGLHPVVKPGK